MLRQIYRGSFLFSLATSAALWPLQASTAYAQDEPPERPLISRILDRIFRDDEERDKPTISRGDLRDLCLIAPAWPEQVNTIWHQQPVFVWQGAVGKIAVRDVASETDIWTYEPTAGETHARYDGAPLQPGRRYRWDIYSSANADSPITFPSFETLPRASHQLIGNGLTVAEQGGEAMEEIAIARANYFANRSLYIDAIQALFVVETPTPALIAGQEQLVDTICAQNNSQNLRSDKLVSQPLGVVNGGKSVNFSDRS
ncbi:hypothetical protein IQ241_21720 [Romeria aff. gracilis LEGE 07310]|uniref:Uncharacterized protein n=1 Tax=Vasconcelosia minhoensis LEGE 07310 TaxID=915328 RepID=A0A8J7DSA1_9CYAN|nr:hypothetical protein [Romeria gracilis]MBE9079879.1 hypothetical protein [Romeria aff. gracilis LEGE 07310]